MRKAGAVGRVTETRVVHVLAVCQNCVWSSDAANALGNAARHHDHHDHHVITEQTVRIDYGTVADPEALGQTTFTDQGEPST